MSTTMAFREKAKLPVLNGKWFVSLRTHQND